MSARIISVPSSITEIEDVLYGMIPVTSVEQGDAAIESVKKLLVEDGYVFVPNTKATSKNSTNCVRAFKGVKYVLGQKLVVNVIMYRTQLGLLHVDINR